MYTSVVLLALASTTTPSADAALTPAWVVNYRLAYDRSHREHKPLAIFFGKGEAGWDQLSDDGTLGEEASRVLRDQYVPVYMDLEQDHGRDTAKDFRVKDGPALVLSDRTCETIALRYHGKLDASTLQRCLVKYADPNRAAQGTETGPRQEVRYYPATRAAATEPTSYAAALADARRADKPLLLVFHAGWCTWCKRMEQETFTDHRVQRVLRRHVVYFVDTDRERGVAARFLPGGGGIPAYCVVNPQDEKVQKNGIAYKTADQFLQWLE